MTMTYDEAATALTEAGFIALVNLDEAAAVCAHDPLEIYAAPDWASLVFYASNYELCECGGH
jgi:hypothetical protein